MTQRKSVKARTVPIRFVGVIASAADFRRAVSLGAALDFLELRLDALYPILPEIERQLGELPAPFIITARHPAEGGRNNLSAKLRRELLLRFLPRASCVDMELRSVAELRPVLRMALDRRIKVIMSVHHLDAAPATNHLERLLAAATRHAADIFKIVTRTDTPGEMQQLLSFFDRHKTEIPISAMSSGAFARETRVKLARAGSVLNYIHLGSAQVEGQLSLTDMRGELARA